MPTCASPPNELSRNLRSLCTVVGLVDSADTPTVKATRRPACLTVDGYAMLSRIVSSAVTRFRMILQSEGARPFGQAGAMTGDVVAPSSVIVASADAGSSPQSTSAPAVARKERFMSRFNTTPRRQLRHTLTTIATWRRRVEFLYCKSASP